MLLQRFANGAGSGLAGTHPSKLSLRLNIADRFGTHQRGLKRGRPEREGAEDNLANLEIVRGGLGVAGQRRSRDVLYYVFDCLWLDGVDLRGVGLMERKRVLRHRLKTNKPNDVFAGDQVETLGKALFKAVCERDCEGMIAKHQRAPFVTRPAV